MSLPSLTAEASLYRSSRNYPGIYQPATENSARGFFPAYLPGKGTQQTCYDCTSGCVESELWCEAGVVAVMTACCVLSLGFACAGCVAAAAVASAACDANLARCMGNCAVTRKCCPKACGVIDPFDPGSGCCDSGESCVDQSDPNSREGLLPGRSSGVWWLLLNLTGRQMLRRHMLSI